MQNELNQYYINLLKEKYTVATKSKKTEYLDEAELFTKLSRKRIIKKLGEKFKKDQTSYIKGSQIGIAALILFSEILPIKLLSILKWGIISSNFLGLPFM